MHKQIHVLKAAQLWKSFECFQYGDTVLMVGGCVGMACAQGNSQEIYQFNITTSAWDLRPERLQGSLFGTGGAIMVDGGLYGCLKHQEYKLPTFIRGRYKYRQREGLVSHCMHHFKVTKHAT